MKIRNTTFAASVIAVAGLGIATYAQMKPVSSRPTAVVYKTSSCGCCSMWVDHLKANGFQVETKDVSSDQVRAVSKAAGLKDEGASCHTAKIGNYVVEGHVPADDVKRLLAERPKVVGLAVPGMPIGSPGMEQGGQKQAYKVMSFDQAGKTMVFSER
jgi:hypothetical protein